ncbi:MAG: type II toxin-antitoxin system prevent-host-death family antitoxin [Sphingomonadaceae bacterium]
MTIHFNIGEAKAQLSKLIAAALRGEEVVIDKDGVPQVRLMPVAERREADLAERERKINEILARVDAMEIDREGPDPIEWDESGLPV